MERYVPFKLVVEVANACGLMPVDGQGYSSACVELSFDGELFRTAVKEKDLNPVWNERFCFHFNPSSSKRGLAVRVYNVKESNYNKSVLGKVEIYRATIPLFSEDVKFHYYKMENCFSSGELCLKVYIANDPYGEAPRHPLRAMDEFQGPCYGFGGDQSARLRGKPLVQAEDWCPRPRDIQLKYWTARLRDMLVRVEDRCSKPRDIPSVQAWDQIPRPCDIPLVQEEDRNPRPLDIPLVQEDDPCDIPLVQEEDPSPRPCDTPLVQEEDQGTRPRDLPLVQEEDPSPRPRDIPLVQEEDPCPRSSDIEFVQQEEDQIPRPRNIPLVQLKEITDNFSDDRLLGHGGFGVVYKGVRQNGEIIAVKKIESSLRPGLQKQFENEVYHLMVLNHPNIVRFVGYCYETQNVCVEYNGKYIFAEMAERLLCLEYHSKGSLDKYLSNESSGLDWSTRYNVIEGICHGLCHLHEKLDKPIIHLDLKPANILLDDGMVPKLTDFGLSRLLDQQKTICTSSRDGTFGYMAPEFLHGGTITPKSDIFSLGVIIIEVVAGHKDYPDVTRTPSDGYIKLTLDKWRKVLQRSPGYESLERDCEQIKRCIQVGLICVNPDRTKRPAIAKIINMLQGSEGIDYPISNGAP